MFIPAWQIRTWDDVRVKVGDWQHAIAKFRLLGITANSDGQLRHGQAIWGSSTAAGMLGIAWDWREAKPGVVALDDPMTVLSNVALVDDDQKPVDAFKKILFLNNAIFSLPWQAKVCAFGDNGTQALAA